MDYVSKNCELTFTPIISAMADIFGAAQARHD